MPIHAATTIPITATYSSALSGLVAVGLLALVITTLGYLTVCWLRPFTRCRHRHPLRRRATRCTRCDGTGYRVRAGRHLLNRLRDSHRRHGRHRDWRDGT
ncbi:hypothetical protein [Kibdelosporangium aridum]|uniref:Uncharacterized protein n=1 Tax=Kibdelosporangium aridum TaxID=2030 RepID=A0A1W2EWT7_KIBAR|nr:hypothetical protein [Kibdelosporangium aridum]SMD14173.1 hypothetical protein SAMN05661093_04983 [Kibdelosporangium aridum]